ncbi:MAG: GerMN domain-containing protein [Deltaproteobacteria bacterium]|nr:GerMN domain-containing protein [Deltaproteobacteria bacterium]
MNRRVALSILLVAVVILVLGLLFWGPWGRGSSSGLASDPGQSLGSGDSNLISATLYFPGPDGKLHSEQVETSSGSPEKRIRGLVEQLLAGPRNRRLWSAFPEGVELAAVYLGTEPVAYVDLHRRDSGPPPAAGSLQETLAIFSLVNSVVLNVSEVERLVLLWNGNQRASFAGHVDTGQALGPRLSLVAGHS